MLATLSAAPAEADPASAPPVAATSPQPPVFRAAERAVSTWRTEAGAHLDLAPAAAADLAAGRDRPVARCVKLNNYWCIKKAGWAGEIAADAEGHVAFSTATEGAAVAALLLKRYYLDFGRKSALAIISRWAPAQCGLAFARGTPARGSRAIAPGLGTTLRARWLAGHTRGFVNPVAGHAAKPRRSIIADRGLRLAPTPRIAVGAGIADRPVTPITLDALLQRDPHAPHARSLIGMPIGGAAPPSIGCGGDGARIAAYAAKAAAGLKTGADGDLGLFDATGAPTDNLVSMMANMARVEIGPLAASQALIRAGIADAFRPGRNPS